MSYQHLSYIQRCRIEAYYKAGYLQKNIAKEVGVHPSTVSREIRRNAVGTLFILRGRGMLVIVIDVKHAVNLRSLWIMWKLLYEKSCCLNGVRNKLVG